MISQDNILDWVSHATRELLTWVLGDTSLFASDNNNERATRP